MAEVLGFPQGGIDWNADEVGAALAGLIARDRDGVVRSGIFPSSRSLISGRADRSVDVAPFLGVYDDSGAIILGGSDAVEQVAIDLPPTSGSRIDRVCWNPLAFPLVVTSGVPGGSPSAPPVPAGMLSLGTVRSFAGDASTSDAIITPDFRFSVAAGGILPVRSQADLATWQPDDGARAFDLSDGSEWVRRGGSWSRPMRAGTLTVATGALQSVAGGEWAKTVNVLVPVVAGPNERIEVTALSIGNGWGVVQQVHAGVPAGGSTNIALRFRQVGSNSPQSLQLLWKLVSLG